MLDFDFIEWDDTNIDHIAEHGLSMDEVEDVIRNANNIQGRSRSSGRPFLRDETSTGKSIVVIYERYKDGRDVIIRPITAYEVGD
jgi:hypothetical protein